MTEEKSHEEQQGSPVKKIIGVLAAVVLTGIVIPTVLLMVTLMGLLGGGAAVEASCTSNGAVGGSSGITDPNSGPAAPANVQKEQLENAKKIDQAAKKLGLPGKASRIAIIAAYGESDLINIGYGDEVKGVKNPDGSATTSKGLFQQQTSMGWGTVAQVTDPEYATTSFLTGPKHDGAAGLVSVPGWETGEPTQIIHKVQANADPNHYASYYAPADKVIKDAGIDVDAAGDDSKQGEWKNKAAQPDATNKADGSSAGGTGCSSDTGSKGGKPGQPGKSGNGKDTYPWADLAPGPGVYNEDPQGFYYGECTSYASWKVNETMGGSKDNIIFNNGYGGHQKGNASTWKAAWEQSGWEVSKTPKAGSVAWWGENGGPGIGSAGHVAWVDEVKPDGKIIISEYNNSYYGPPGHKYSVRPEPVDPSEVNAFLYPPSKK